MNNTWLNLTSLSTKLKTTHTYGVVTSEGEWPTGYKNSSPAAAQQQELVLSETSKEVSHSILTTTSHTHDYPKCRHINLIKLICIDIVTSSIRWRRSRWQPVAAAPVVFFNFCLFVCFLLLFFVYK